MGRLVNPAPPVEGNEAWHARDKKQATIGMAIGTGLVSLVGIFNAVSSEPSALVIGFAVAGAALLGTLGVNSYKKWKKFDAIANAKANGEGPNPPDPW